jgi:hypothetical protein
MKLRNLIFLLTLAALTQGCGHSLTGQVNEQTRSTFYNLKEKFKYHDLKLFETDTFSFDTRPGYYNEVDSSAFKLIFQEGDRQFIGQGYDRDYYFSWQNRDPNFIEFTILTQDESSYCDLLRYYIFDKTGKFISKFDIASNCGDAGWTFTAKGKQLDQNSFSYYTVESDQKDGTMPEEEKYEGDSIKYIIKIDPQGKVMKRETYKKHFSNE